MDDSKQNNSSQTLIAALHKSQQVLQERGLLSLFEKDRQRAAAFSCQAAGLHLDYSKNRLDKTAFNLLIELADQLDMTTAIRRLFDGETVNPTEQRPALHSLLRANPDESRPETLTALYTDVQTALSRMGAMVEKIHSGQWKGFSDKAISHIVNIGIGGSDLGPSMVTKALSPYLNKRIAVDFVSNIDAACLHDVLDRCDPQTTLFVVSSKSFTTTETLMNAESARQWLKEAGCQQSGLKQHFIGITADETAAMQYGIEKNHILPLWSWVGGRYSLWSSIGLPIALATDMRCFRQLLSGAQRMDAHFGEAPLSANMPVILGLLSHWSIRFWDHNSQAILPYNHDLNLLPAYLQQLEMESNGKTCQLNGMPGGPTGPVIWGSEGSNCQHSFFQLLHQGTQVIPVDFIVSLQSHYDEKHHKLLFANCLSQSRALMVGKTTDQIMHSIAERETQQDELALLVAHKVMPGNRPSNTITMDKLTPDTLGALIALYEHKVFVQSVLWNINPFDQWGVELGKEICSQMISALDRNDLEMYDSSTSNLLKRYRAAKENR